MLRCATRADVAQLVEHHLAKVRVAGSNPVVRSKARPPDRYSSRPKSLVGPLRQPRQGVLAHRRRLYYDRGVVDTGNVSVRDERGSVLGPLEREVMRALWAAKEPLSVRAVLERLNDRRRPPLAYTTVMTVLSRLTEKEIVRRQRAGRGYVYEAALPNEAAIAVRETMRDFGDAAVAHFVDEARADPRLRRRLQRLLDEDQP